jgi:chorismate dehydratase
MVPSELGGAIAQGEVDAGPLPLVDCLQLDEQYRFLSGFCLATVRKTSSVALHSKRPIHELSGAEIGIPDEAATATLLLKVLLTLKHGVQPAAFVTRTEASEAFLLIGSEGLRQRHGVWDYPHTYDLGEEWAQWTGLPFVFLRWVVSKTLDRKAVAALEDALYTGMQDWADGLFRAAEGRDNVLMHPRDILEYTQGIRYFLGVPEQRAIERFQQCVEQLKTQAV